MPERLRTLDHARPWRDDQFASPACHQTGACRGSGARYAFRPPERSYLDTRRSRRPEASSIALSTSNAFCVMSRSCLVPGVCRSIHMVFSSMVPAPGFQPRFFRLANEKTVHRTRTMPFTSKTETQNAQEFGRYL